ELRDVDLLDVGERGNHPGNENCGRQKRKKRAEQRELHFGGKADGCLHYPTLRCGRETGCMAGDLCSDFPKKPVVFGKVNALARRSPFMEDVSALGSLSSNCNQIFERIIKKVVMFDENSIKTLNG